MVLKKESKQPISIKYFVSVLLESIGRETKVDSGVEIERWTLTKLFSLYRCRRVTKKRLVKTSF